MHAEPRFHAGNSNPEYDDGWTALRSRLPCDLDERSRASGAIRRLRQVRSGEQLLRLILVYVTCWFSLRDTAAWAERALGILLTDGALGYRFACAVDFIQGLVLAVLRQQLGEKKRTGAAVRILDATALNRPGSKGTDKRLHVTYTVGEGVVGVELTDADGAEHLARAAAEKGDLVLVDRGYGHAQELRTARRKGEDCLVRIHLQNLPVEGLDGKRRPIEALVRETDKVGVFDEDVQLPEKGHDSVPVRLVMTPLPPEKAARQRQKVRRTAAKKGKTPNKLALKLAGYFCCVTTMPAKRVAAQVLLAWYRVRWQVELWFKRAKSLLGLDRLTKAGPQLVAIQIWGRLLVALLIQRLLPAPLDPPASAGRPPISDWRLMHLYWVDVALAIYGGTSFAARVGDIEALERLRERPRKRQSGAANARQIEDVINFNTTPAAR